MCLCGERYFRGLRQLRVVRHKRRYILSIYFIVSLGGLVGPGVRVC